MKVGLLSKIKNKFVKPGKKIHVGKFGLLKDIKFLIDLSYQTQLYLGLYEQEIYRWTRNLSEDINTAIDIGAGEGEYTLYFAKKTSAKSVISCEPNEKIRGTLLKNLELNKPFENCEIKLIKKFLGETNSPLICSLDSLISFINEPCLVKIDVDGAEVDILRGASQLLKSQKVTRWIIETHSKDLEEQCAEILRKAGFITKIIPNARWRLFISDQRQLPFNRWLIASRDHTNQVLDS